MAQESDLKTAIAEKLGRPRFWVLLTASLFFLFTSTVWEAHELQTANFGQQITDQAPPSSQSGQDERVFVLFTPRPYIELFRELGFGCLIALVLIVFVERSARVQQARSADKQREEISKNVFQGVFSLQTPAAIVQAACDQIFKAKVIREHHKNHYDLKDLRHTDPDVDCDSAIADRFVELDVTSDYILRNVSDGEIEIPIRLGFPVPPVSRFLTRVKVHSISIGGQAAYRRANCRR